MQTFRYRTYGLNVESEIECANLPSTTGEPDVRVRLGYAPEQLENATYRERFYAAQADEFLLNLPGVGRFWVRQGEEIVIEPDERGAPEQVQAYAFGSLFGVLLLQRGRVPLHASAVATPAGAVLFTGPSGFGKSTTAAEFARRGYALLADDVCRVTCLDGKAHIHPARPTLLLRQDSLNRLDMAQVGLRAAPHNAHKSLVPVGAGYSDEPAAVRVVYVLSPSETSCVRLAPTAGFERLAALAANVYRPYLLNGVAPKESFLRDLETLAHSARVVKVERPTIGFLLLELADAIEEDLEENP